MRFRTWLRPLSWLAGIALALLSPVQPALWWLLPAIAVLLLLYLPQTPALLVGGRRVLMQCLLLFCFGVGLGSWHLDRGVQQMRACAERDSALPLKGRYLGAPRRSGSGWSAVFAAEGGAGKILVRGAEPAPAAGSRWQLQLSPVAAPPRQRAWLLRSGLCGTARLRAQLSRQLEPGHSSWRLRLSDKVRTLAGGEAEAAVLRAITLGDGSGLDKATWDRFRRTGTIHLLVVSGLHLGLVALVAAVSLGNLPRLFRPALLWLPAQSWRWLVVLAAALAYASLAGFTVSVRRALAMLTMAALLALCHRSAFTPLALLQILALLLLLDPLAALAPGLWLSFAGVAVLLTWSGLQPRPLGANGSRAGRIGHRLRQFLGAQFAITLAMIPALTLSSIQPSLLSLPANLLAVPLLGMLAVPLGLCGVALASIADWLGAVPLRLAGWCAALTLTWIDWLAGLGGPQLQLHGWAPLLASLLAVALLLAPPGMPGKGLWPLLGLCALVSGLTAADRPLQLQLQPMQQGEISAELNFAGRSLRLYSDRRGTRWSADGDPGYGCALIRWQRGSVAVRSISAGSRHCLLSLRGPGGAALLVGALPEAAAEALWRKLRRTPKAERDYDLLLAPSLAPHSYALLALLQPSTALLFGNARSEGEQRYRWFGVELRKYAQRPVRCGWDSRGAFRCRPARQPWWKIAPLRPEAGT